MPGSLITADYQYEFNGLLFGSLTPYHTTKVDGMLALPPIVQNHVKNSVRHGSILGYETMDARVISMDIAIVIESGITPGADAQTLLDGLDNYLTLPSQYADDSLISTLGGTSVDMGLCTRRPGHSIRMCLCHVTKRDFSSTSEVANGYAAGSVEFYAADPRWYSTNQYTALTTIAGGTNNASFNYVQGGNAPSPNAAIHIAGPGTGPWIITNAASGRSLRLNMNLSPTDVVDIDLNLRTIKLNGVDYYVARRADSQWWEMRPGSNVITCQRASSDALAATFTVTYSYAWLGA